jgi:hypothetical protein
MRGLAGTGETPPNGGGGSDRRGTCIRSHSVRLDRVNLDVIDPAVASGPALFAVLAVLALVDSTSFGTLLIPIWLLLAPGRLRIGRILVYLATVAGFYFLVGILLATVATAFLPQITQVAGSPAFLWAQLLVGAALLAGSFFLGAKRRANRRPGRFTRWRERAVTDVGDLHASLLPLMGLALAAAGIEVASMLPYLVSIGLVSSSGMTLAVQVLVLAGYCVVMVAPALVLLAIRFLARSAIEPMLRRVGNWLERTAAEATAWVVGILGFLIARNAALELGLFEGFLR